MDALKSDNGTPEERVHKIGVRWSERGKENLLRIDLPWDSDANDWAEAFQRILLSLGFSEKTVVEYVESELMGKDDVSYAVSEGAEELEKVCKEYQDD